MFRLNRGGCCDGKGGSQMGVIENGGDISTAEDEFGTGKAGHGNMVVGD